MAYTQTDVDALKASIGRGIRQVSYTDRTVTYSSLAEMRQVLALMEADVAAASGAPRPRVYLGSGSKGLGC